jgi:hypothetical protein
MVIVTYNQIIHVRAVDKTDWIYYDTLLIKGTRSYSNVTIYVRDLLIIGENSTLILDNVTLYLDCDASYPYQIHKKEIKSKMIGNATLILRNSEIIIDVYVAHGDQLYLALLFVVVILVMLFIIFPLIIWVYKLRKKLKSFEHKRTVNLT